MRTSQEGTEETYQTMAKKVVVKMNNYVHETKIRTPQDCAEKIIRIWFSELCPICTTMFKKKK